MANDLLVSEGSGPKTVKTLELSSNLHLPTSLLLDGDGAEVFGQADAVAFNGTDPSTSAMALFRAIARDVALQLAAMTNANAVSLVRDVDLNAGQNIAIICGAQNTSAAADTLLGNWGYSLEGAAPVGPANEYIVPASKRLLVNSGYVHIKMQGTHSAAGVLTATLRWASSGSISTSSARLAPLVLSYGSVANAVSFLTIPIGAKGWDFAAGTRIGASAAQEAWASGTNQASITIVLIGREYDDTP